LADNLSGILKAGESARKKNEGLMLAVCVREDFQVAMNGIQGSTVRARPGRKKG